MLRLQVLPFCGEESDKCRQLQEGPCAENVCVEKPDTDSARHCTVTSTVSRENLHQTLSLLFSVPESGVSEVYQLLKSRINS